MPTYPQGLFTFPGISDIMSGTYVCTHGVYPGRVLIRSVYAGGPPLETGDLKIQYGGDSWAIRDCRVVDRRDYLDPDQGVMTDWTLEDRRWRWEFGAIDGHYNRKGANGQIYRGSEKTPRQLVELLLQAMGETGRFQIRAALPSNIRPEVEWVAANPARELSALCDALGVRIVFDPSSNRVLIEPWYNGNVPYRDSVDFSGKGGMKPVTPSGILVVGDVTRVQSPLRLLPRVRDVDGSLKHPAELSYAASLAQLVNSDVTHWFETLRDDFDVVENETHRNLLIESMWRYFEIDEPGDAIRGYFGHRVKAENISLLLVERVPGQDGLVTTEGYVAGIFCSEFDENTDPNNPDGSDVVFTGSVRIENDYDFPYVVVDRQLYKWEGEGEDEKIVFPDLYVICSYNVRDVSDNGKWNLNTYQYTLELDGEPGVGPEVFRDGDLALEIVQQFDLTTAEPSGSFPTSNQGELDGVAWLMASVQADRWRGHQTAEAVYNEFFKAEMSGGIHAIEWSFSDRGAFTKIYENQEPLYVALSHDDRVLKAKTQRQVNAQEWRIPR